MALTSPEQTQVNTYVGQGLTMDAVDYLIGQGYSREYAQRRVAVAQQINVDPKITRGSIEERDAISSKYLYEGRRFIVVPDGVNADDAEGVEYIYANGEWKNPSGFAE